MALTGKQKRKLRALGHHLEVVVQIGQHGITAGVVMAAEQALFDHELVKVKFPEGREERDGLVKKLAEETGAEVAQRLGRTALFYKRRAEKSKIAI